MITTIKSGKRNATRLAALLRELDTEALHPWREGPANADQAQAALIRGSVVEQRPPVPDPVLDLMLRVRAWCQAEGEVALALDDDGRLRQTIARETLGWPREMRMITLAIAACTLASPAIAAMHSTTLASFETHLDQLLGRARTGRYVVEPISIARSA